MMVILIGSFSVEFWGFSRFHMGILIKHILIKSSNYSKMRLLYRIQDIRMLLPESLFQYAKPDGKGEKHCFYMTDPKSWISKNTHTNRCVRSYCGEIQLYAARICTHRHVWTFNMLDVLVIFFHLFACTVF